MYTPDFNFYTIWSNVAFYAVLLMYILFGNRFPSDILYAFVINMIVVGIMGNVIIAFKIKNIAAEFGSDIETIKIINLTNLFLHVVPLVIAFIFLLCIPHLGVNYYYTTAIILLFMLIWCVVPDKGKIFKRKIDANYGEPGAGYYVAFFVILFVITMFSKYNKVLCSTK